MPTYTVIDQVSNIGDGPVAFADEGDPQPLHLQQGDMDGACTLYSASMALIALGLFRREKLTATEAFDGRTRIGKFQRDLAAGFSALVKEGVNADEVTSVLRRTFPPTALQISFEAGTNNKVAKFIVENLRLNRPVVVAYYGDDVAHACLAVGYADTIEGHLPEILLLDPGSPAEKFCSWNDTLYPIQRHARGKRPFRLTSQAGQVELEFGWALALWRP